MGESSRMRQVVAVVKPFGAQHQRNEQNLYLPSNLSPSPSRVVSPSPAPSIIDVVSERDDDSDNDDSGNENRPFSMDIDASPSVEYLPPPTVEEIPQALIQEVDTLQNLSPSR